MLRYRADVRSVFFMLFTMALLIFLWNNWSALPSVVFIVLYAFLLLFAVTASVITHNHQHLPIWTNKWMNVLTDNWLTIFYGFPIFAWVPTHNINHHKYINTEPDYTKTYRYSEKNNLLTLLTYPSISGFFQQKAIKEYLKSLKTKDRERYYLSWLQIVVLVTWILAALAINWKNALVFIIIPQQVSMFAVLIFNYVQHVHADEEDDYNHSRNFLSPIMNFFWLNNGYHTAHHIQTYKHWSELPAVHREIEDKIDPVLNEKSFVWYLVRNYLLGIFVASLRTVSLRQRRMQKQVEAPAS